jgi:prepilin-type N-terminal cleavage/methylation domain-containing protein
MSGRRRVAGFTLVELLIVSAIVVLVSTTTVFLVGNFFRGSSVKEGGRIVRSAFYRARMQASALNRMHFLVFDMANSTMRVYEDSDKNRLFSTKDTLAGVPIQLPHHVYFDKVFGETNGKPYAAFQPDGSALFYKTGGTVCVDVSWSDPGSGYIEGSDNPPRDSDIVLRLGPSSADAPDKVYCDVHPLTGIVRRIEYFHRTTTPLP